MDGCGADHAACFPSRVRGGAPWLTGTTCGASRSLLETAEKASYGGATGWTVKGKGFVWERPLRRADLAALHIPAPRRARARRDGSGPGRQGGAARLTGRLLHHAALRRLRGSPRPVGPHRPGRAGGTRGGGVAGAGAETSGGNVPGGPLSPVLRQTTQLLITMRGAPLVPAWAAWSGSGLPRSGTMRDGPALVCTDAHMLQEDLGAHQ